MIDFLNYQPLGTGIRILHIIMIIGLVYLYSNINKTDKIKDKSKWIR